MDDDLVEAPVSQLVPQPDQGFGVFVLGRAVVLYASYGSPGTFDVMNVPDNDEFDEGSALLEAALGDSEAAFLDDLWMHVLDIVRATDIARNAARLAEPEAGPE